jgi:hypothetical protein
MEQFGAALGHSAERLDTVLAELQHQMRNLISVVGTIADSTMRTSETFERSDTVHLSSRMSGSPFDGRWKLWVEVATFASSRLEGTVW